MNGRTMSIVLLVGVLAAAGGCATALKEGASLATGAKGTVTDISAQSPDDLGRYRRFELGPITDAMGGKAPAELFARLPEEFADALKNEEIPNEASGKTLLIRGEILHYEDASAVGKALGPVEFVVARIEFVDKDSGRVLGVANCVGRTTTRVMLGVGRKAEGLAKAIVKWIERRYPKDQRIDD